MLWDYHIGEPVVESVVTVEHRAYVVSQFGSFYCFDVRSGKKLWEASGVKQFVAQAKDRLYVVDKSGDRLSTLRVSDGQRIDRLPISGFTRFVANGKTDRLFLVSETGFVQSLRQRGVKAPIRYQ